MRELNLATNVIQDILTRFDFGEKNGGGGEGDDGVNLVRVVSVCGGINVSSASEVFNGRMSQKRRLSMLCH